ncbi:MAG: alanine racemase [Bdellovibrionales bacterium]
MIREFQDVGAMLAALKPDEPVFAMRPRVMRRAAQFFASQFIGDIAYAVRANPRPECLAALYEGGIRHFAVAGLAELRAVKDVLPDASCLFTHPAVSAAAIREAAQIHGVAHFTIDSREELGKVIAHSAPRRPTVIVRVAVPRNVPAHDALDKFGCSPAEAAGLLRAAASQGLGIGLGFNIESQVFDKALGFRALECIALAARAAGLQPELIDAGGFPAADSLPDYCRAIWNGVMEAGFHHPVRLLGTPGRALAADSASLIVRVDLRRGKRLYLNDGLHGGLGEFARAGFRPPLRVWRLAGEARLLGLPRGDFSFFGPSLDEADRLPGPYALPADIAAGDYIEIGGMGAAGMSLRSDFAGFLSVASVIVNDPPFSP